MPDRRLTSELMKTYGLDVPCPRCGYNLRGNQGGRCPECGANVESYLKKASLGRQRRRIIHTQDIRDRFLAYAGPTLAIGAATTFWAGIHFTDAPVVIDRIAAGAMAIMVLAAADVWWHLVRRLWRRAGALDLLLRVIACWTPGLSGLAALLALTG